MKPISYCNENYSFIYDIFVPSCSETAFYFCPFTNNDPVFV